MSEDDVKGRKIWPILSPCMVEPVAALVADCSVKSTGSYIQYSTSPSSYSSLETSHSKTLSNLLEWQKSHLNRTGITCLQIGTLVSKPHAKHTLTCPMQSQSKSGVEEPLNRSDGGHSIILINFPIESVSKSPQDKQNEQSHSQSSSWWAKISLCKVESQRVKISAACTHKT